MATSADARWLVTAGPGPQVRLTDLQTGDTVRELTTTAPAARDQQLAADVLVFARAEYNRFNAQVEQHTKGITERTAALTQAMTAKQAAEQDLATKQAAADAAMAELTAAQQKHMEATTALAAAEAKVTESTAALESAKKAETTAADQLTALEQASQAAAAAVDPAKMAQTEAAKKVEMATLKQAEAQKALQAAMQAKAAAEQQAASAQAAIDELQKVLTSAQSQRDLAGAAVREAEVKHQQAGDAVSAPRPPTAIAFAPDGTGLLIGSRDGSALLFGLPEGGGPGVIKLHDSPVVSLNFAVDGQLVSTAANGEVRIGAIEPAWQLERTIEPAESGAPPLDRVLALAFSPDGTLLASGGGVPSREGELLLWNASDGTLARRIEKPHGDAVLDLAFFLDGSRLASTAADRFAKVFNPATGELIRTFEGHTGHVLSATWSRNGLHLATGGADKVVKIWDFHAGSQVRTIEGFDKPVTRVRYLGYRDEMAVSWGVGGAQFVHENGTRGKTLDAGGDYIHTLDATPDGRLIASGGDDGVLRIWEIPSGELLATFAPPQ